MSGISFDIPKAQFFPRETITGMLHWELPVAPGVIEVELNWETRGKGTVDRVQARSVTVQAMAAAGSAPFSIALPDSPYSFSGKLVSYQWTLRAVGLGVEVSAPIVMSATACEVLPSLAE